LALTMCTTQVVFVSEELANGNVLVI